MRAFLPATVPPRPEPPAASRASTRFGPTRWVLALFATIFIGGMAAQQVLEPPGEVIRDGLIAAAVELQSSVGPEPSETALHSIRRHFPSQETTIDAASWPQVTVTLHHLDRSTCTEAVMTARRLEGLVVVELKRYGSAAACGDDNEMTWWIAP